MRINISIDLEASEINLANEIIYTLKCAALPRASGLHVYRHPLLIENASGLHEVAAAVASKSYCCSANDING